MTAEFKLYVGYPMHYYEQVEGNDDWSDFIEMLQFFNESSDSDFLDSVEDRVDIRNLLRSMVVESFLLSSDNFAGGNNFYVYHQTDEAVKNQMTMFSYDFESVFIFDKNTNEPRQEWDIFQFFNTTLDTNYENINPLFDRLLDIPKFQQQYLEYYSVFLDSIFGSESKQQPADRFARILQFVLPWASRDYLWQMSYGITPDNFILVSETSISNFPKRVDNVTIQINSYK
jgi:hypothetical protein